MRDDELDRLLHNAPVRATPPEDSWPGIARRTRPARRWPVAAAAMIIFGLGLAAGLALRIPGSQAARDLSPGPTDPPSSAFIAAARVQSAASAYVAEVGRLDALTATASSRDSAALAQGYEAALAAMEAVGPSLAGSLVLDERGSPLAREIARARDLASRRVSVLVEQMGT